MLRLRVLRAADAWRLGGVLKHDRNDVGDGKNEGDREADPDDDEVNGFAVREVPLSILAGLHAESCGSGARQHLPERKGVAVVFRFFAHREPRKRLNTLPCFGTFPV